MRQDNIQLSFKKWIICFLLASLLISVFYIKSDNDEGYEKKIDFYTGVLSLGLRDSKFESLKSNHLALDEELEYNITFSSTLKDIKEYMFFIIVNNKIQNFIIEDKLVNNHTFKLTNNDTEHINLKFPAEMANGLHNGLLIFVPEPIIKNDDNHKRIKEDLFIARFTAEKGNDTMFAYDISENVNTNLYKISYSPDEPKEFFITESNLLEFPIRTNTIAHITNTSLLRYYAHKVNFSKYTNNYTLLALKDWENTSINKIEAIHFTLDPNEKITFPLKLEIDSTKDNNKELVFLLIENPTFIMKPELKEKYINENFSIEVFTSQRILLTVDSI